MNTSLTSSANQTCDAHRWIWMRQICKRRNVHGCGRLKAPLDDDMNRWEVSTGGILQLLQYPMRFQRFHVIPQITNLPDFPSCLLLFERGHRVERNPKRLNSHTLTELVRESLNEKYMLKEQKRGLHLGKSLTSITTSSLKNHHCQAKIRHPKAKISAPLHQVDQKPHPT